MLGATPQTAIRRRVEEEQILRPRRSIARSGPPPISWGRNYALARGAYRVFNAAGYRFFRSNTGPPATTDTPFATSSTLPVQPAISFADGTWYVSASYFNGVLDSGFLPLGNNGETYLKLEISSGSQLPTRPAAPQNVQALVLPATVIRVQGVYLAAVDGANAATEWAISYTTDGSAPTANSPTVVVAMSGGPMALLSYDLLTVPAAVSVRILVQVRRGTIYSIPGAEVDVYSSTFSPLAPVDLQAWPGQLPADA